jgi:predicted ArsR family transcriptional regulator
MALKQLARILDELAKAPATVEDLAEETGLGCEAVRSGLHKLKKDGYCQVMGSLPNVRGRGRERNIWRVSV